MRKENQERLICLSDTMFTPRRFFGGVRDENREIFGTGFPERFAFYTPCWRAEVALGHKQITNYNFKGWLFFNCLVPVRLLLSSMEVLYHVID